MPQAFAYVDGAFLRDRASVAAQRLFGVSPELDVNQIRASLSVSRLYYYDCVEDAPRPDETEAAFNARTDAQRSLIARINEAPMCHVRLGTLKHQQQGRRITQKEVDVKIAVDVLAQATSRVIDKAILVTGDLDFRPLVESLVQLGTVVELVYDPLVTATELRHAADINRPIDADMWVQWCTPAFQKAHRMPRRWMGGSREGIVQLLATGTCANHPMKVWKAENDLFTIEIEGCDDNMTLFIQGPDLDFLIEKYLPLRMGQTTTTPI